MRDTRYYKENRRVLIFYMNENADIVQGYFYLVDIREGYVVFDSKDNRFIIPLVRVLKIKDKLDFDGEYDNGVGELSDE